MTLAVDPFENPYEAEAPAPPRPAGEDVPVSRDIGSLHVMGLFLLSLASLIVVTLALSRAGVRGAPLPLSIGAKLVTATIALAIVDRLDWWRRIGFRSPSRWGRLWLGWLPLLYLLFAFAPGFPASTVVRVLGVAALCLAVGLDEEVWTRGLLLESLRHRGTTLAVILSALGFGALHAVNAVTGQPVSTTLVQVVVATSFGLAFGALRVRTHSIWPCILIHAAWDFALILRSGQLGETTGRSLQEALITVAFMSPLAIYGLVLARPSKVPGRDGRMRHRGEPDPVAEPAEDPPADLFAPPPPDALGPWPAPPPEVQAIYRGW